jgi:hypothetical protein
MKLTNLTNRVVFIGDLARYDHTGLYGIKQGIKLLPMGDPSGRDVKDGLPDFIYSDGEEGGVRREELAGNISVEFSTGRASGVTQPELDAAIAGVGGGGVTAAVLNPVLVGQPVYMTPAAVYDLADATNAAKQNVLGFSTVNALTGFPALVVTEGGVTRADWTPVTGTPTLTPGAAYYLGTVPGTMSLIPPSGAGLYLRQLGRATGSLSFDIEIGQSILLA